MATKWWNKDESIPFENSNFQKILDFYLFKCPCEIKKNQKNKNIIYMPVSSRNNTFRKQGWIGGKLNTLRSAMRHTSSKNLEYHIIPQKNEIVAESNRVEDNASFGEPHFEMIVISERSDMSKTSAIFYYIRNALAHGSFGTTLSSGKRTYYFESTKDGVVKARIRLREETLLSWIHLFFDSPNALKISLEQNRKNNKKYKRSSNVA